MARRNERARLRERAASGDVGACIDLRNDLDERKPIRLAEAAHWTRRAAELGSYWAQGALGYCYAVGRGVPRDHRKAVFWWRLLVENLDTTWPGLLRARTAGSRSGRKKRELEQTHRQLIVPPMYSLALSHLSGEGASKNTRRAFEWFRRAAELGDSRSAIVISEMIRDEEIDLHPREAVRWIRRAAEAGDADAQVSLGVRLSEGRGVQRDHEEEMRWYLAAARQGHPKAWSHLGQMHRLGQATEKSWPKALACFRRAARPGDEEAFYWLVRYHDGHSGSPRNARLVQEWLRRAEGMARRGHENLCAMLGEHYGGKDADGDDPRAIRWLRLGAAKNDEWSLVFLGCHLFKGAGVKRDRSRAARLYRRAAELGSPRGSYLLGLCYRDGDGVRRDRRAARAWFQRAASRGESDARRELAKLDSPSSTR